MQAFLWDIIYVIACSYMKPKGKAPHPSASLPLIVDVNKDSTFPIGFFLYTLHVFASSINFLFMYLSFFGDETQNMCHRRQAETNWTHETFPFHGERRGRAWLA